MKKVIPFLLLFVLWSFKTDTIKDTHIRITTFAQKKHKVKQDHQIRTVQKAVIVPTLDGMANDPIWETTTWYAIDQRWAGDSYSFRDFFGRYKMAWTPETLYLLVETKDDILRDTHQNPLTSWTKDDGIVLFLDTDNSGGLYQRSHNAFTYHITIDGHAVAFNAEKEPVLRDHHIQCKQTIHRDVTTWELAITLYDDDYIENQPNDAMICRPNQKLGFAIGYIDRDQSSAQEHYVGSVFIPGSEKLSKLYNADTFGTLILKE